MRYLIPDAELDCNLIPCPKCGAVYVPVGKRPAILMFTIEHYQVVCLCCNHRGMKAKNVKRAMRNWNRAYGWSMDWQGGKA